MMCRSKKVEKQSDEGSVGQTEQRLAKVALRFKRDRSESEAGGEGAA